MHLGILHSILACISAIECPFRPFSSILPAYAGGSPDGLLASWLVGSPLGVYLPIHPKSRLGRGLLILASLKASGSEASSILHWNLTHPQVNWVGDFIHAAGSPCGHLSASLPPGSSHRVHLHGSFDSRGIAPRCPLGLLRLAASSTIISTHVSIS